MTKKIAIYAQDVADFMDNRDGVAYAFEADQEQDVEYRDTNLTSVRKYDAELVGYFEPTAQIEIARCTDGTLRMYVDGYSYSAADVVAGAPAYNGFGHYASI